MQKMEDILSEFSPNQKNLIHILRRVQAKFGCIPLQAISQIASHVRGATIVIIDGKYHGQMKTREVEKLIEKVQQENEE